MSEPRSAFALLIEIQRRWEGPPLPACLHIATSEARHRKLPLARVLSSHWSGPGHTPLPPRMAAQRNMLLHQGFENSSCSCSIVAHMHMYSPHIYITYYILQSAWKTNTSACINDIMHYYVCDYIYRWLAMACKRSVCIPHLFFTPIHISHHISLSQYQFILGSCLAVLTTHT